MLIKIRANNGKAFHSWFRWLFELPKGKRLPLFLNKYFETTIGNIATNVVGKCNFSMPSFLGHWSWLIEGCYWPNHHHRLGKQGRRMIKIQQKKRLKTVTMTWRWWGRWWPFFKILFEKIFETKNETEINEKWIWNELSNHVRHWI